MPSQPLQRAVRMLRRQKFKEVVHLLEPQIFKFRSSFRFYYLLGVSCLYMDDIEGAWSYLDRANQITKADSNCLLGLAAVHLKKSEFEQSIKIWLQILEHDKNNRIAKRGLNILKKNVELSSFNDSQETIHQLFPPVGSGINPLPVALVIILLLGITLSIPVIRGSLREARPESRNFKLPSEGAIIQKEGTFRFEYTQNEIKNIFAKAKEHFNRFRDNLCVVELNRLLNSNATEEVKQIASVIKEYIQEPNFITIKDSFSLEEIQKAPFLYQDCYILWKGKIANLEIDSDLISFDFLVGYHEEKELVGIVSVDVAFAADLSNGGNLELLAQVKYSGDSTALRGISLHKLK